MSNAFKTSNWISMDVLMTLKATGSLGPSFNTDYNKELTQEFPVGETFQVPYPFRFTIRDGEQMVPKDVTRKTTTVAMEAPWGVDFAYSDFERALKMDRSEDMLRKEFTKPAGEQMASELDTRLAYQAYMRVPGIVGALGTDPTLINTYRLANQRMMEFGCPAGEKRIYMTPGMASAVMNTAATNFLPNTDVTDFWREGNIGMLSGAKTFESVRLQSHTTGIVTSNAALTVAGNVTDGATSVTINCTSGDTFAKGERVAFDASFFVHPQTRRRAGTALGNQAVYIVQQAVTASSTTCVLQLDRAIIGPGTGADAAYQNVDALPLNAALVTRWPGTTIANGTAVTGSVGFRLHRTALALVGAKLQNPKAVEMAQQTRDPDTGMAVSIVQQYNNTQRTNGTRMDCWTGYGSLYASNSGVCILGL